MKASTIRQFGDFDVMKFEDIPTPKPKRGNVLVKILAAGVNRPLARPSTLLRAVVFGGEAR